MDLGRRGKRAILTGGTTAVGPTIAHTGAFLAGLASSSTTGADLRVDGGTSEAIHL